MKKIFLVMVISFIALTFLMAGLSFAEDQGSENALTKGFRGLGNVTFGTAELLKSVEDTLRKDGFMAAITYGVARGLAKAAVREAVGLYEVVTFAFKPYEPVLKEQNFWDWDKDELYPVTTPLTEVIDQGRAKAKAQAQAVQIAAAQEAAAKPAAKTPEAEASPVVTEEAEPAAEETPATTEEEFTEPKPAEGVAEPYLEEEYPENEPAAEFTEPEPTEEELMETEPAEGVTETEAPAPEIAPATKPELPLVNLEKPAETEEPSSY